MSFHWQWLGDEDVTVLSGTATFWFSEKSIAFDLPNAGVARDLGIAIERELREAKREGAEEMVEAIEKVIGDTR